MSAFADLDDELAFLELSGHDRGTDYTDKTLLKHQLVTSPLLNFAALKQHAEAFPSRGMLGTTAGERFYMNTNTPSSGVICGVPGSGKSHTLSCILECSLVVDSRIGQLPKPLAALMFHFDDQDCNRPAEAAFLSCPTSDNVTKEHRDSLPKITVLCSPSNVTRRRRAYATLPRVRVEPFYFSEKDLTADRMLAIMGCDSDLGTMPLYMHSALLIIRNMGVDAFNYQEFKRRIHAEKLNPAQKAMIKLRLDLLDAFLRPGAQDISSCFSTGNLALVDLTDPFLDGLTASVLFDIVLGLFMQWQTVDGKIVVLDEAHKYLINSNTARLTQSITSIIRLQRHLATRIIIATQEPTVIPSTVLDLASFIICHRFSSPSWCRHLSQHVSTGDDVEKEQWFQDVMLLATGHCLVFSPSALVVTNSDNSVQLLGSQHLKLRVRPRLTRDGGTSLLAVNMHLPATSDSLSTHLESPDKATAISVPREVPPARLMHLIRLLKLSNGVNTPLNLCDVVGKLSKVGKVEYGCRKQWWKEMLDEAQTQGLVELTNFNVNDIGRAKIRLLYSGPFTRQSE